MDVSSTVGPRGCPLPPSKDQISFPPDRLSEHHGPHLQCAINTNEETNPFPLKKTFPIPAQTGGRTLAWASTIQQQSLTASLQFTLAHCLKPFSKQWQHYLQDSYKTGFVRTKNNKAVLSLSFFLPPFPRPKSLSPPVQNSDTFPKRHLHLSISTEPADDNSPGTRTAVRRHPEEQQSSLSTFVK